MLLSPCLPELSMPGVGSTGAWTLPARCPARSWPILLEAQAVNYQGVCNLSQVNTELLKMGLQIVW